MPRMSKKCRGLPAGDQGTPQAAGRRYSPIYHFSHRGPQQKAGRNAGQDCCPHGRQAPRGAVRTADPSRLGRVGQRGGADSRPLVTVARR